MHRFKWRKIPITLKIPPAGDHRARPWGLAKEEEKLSSPEKDLDESFGLFNEGN
jgi:hypothetical protein